MAVEMTSVVDVSVIQNAIPELVAFGRRTLREQCTTSAGIIAVNSQKRTPFVEIGTIDAELDVVELVTNKHPRFIKTGKATHGTIKIGVLQWTEGMMIAVQRTNPKSPFSLLTGNRWPIAYPGGLKGYARWEFFKAAAERMRSARHSSTHFLQHGWTPGIKTLLGSPDFKGWNSKYGGGVMRSDKNTEVNPLNDLSPELLGSATFKEGENDFEVTTENAIGDNGNDVLAKKHRKAMYDYALPVLQEEIDREGAVINAKIQEYIDRGMRPAMGKFDF